MKTNCTYDKHNDEFIVELDGFTHSMTPGEFDAFARAQFEAEAERAGNRNNSPDPDDLRDEMMERGLA